MQRERRVSHLGVMCNKARALFSGVRLGFMPGQASLFFNQTEQ